MNWPNIIQCYNIQHTYQYTWRFSLKMDTVDHTLEFKYKHILLKTIQQCDPKKYISKSQPPIMTSSQLNTCWTGWVQYPRQLRWWETANLLKCVFLLCCFKPIVFTKQSFVAYLSSLFYNLKLDAMTGFSRKIRRWCGIPFQTWK